MATPSLLPSRLPLESDRKQPAHRHAARPDRFSPSSPSTYVLGVAIMAVVTLTERALDGANTGFALEWAILTFVALVTFGLLAQIISRATRATMTWLGDYAQHAAKTRADVRLLEMARRDPRVMNEILAAQGRAEAVRTNVRLRAATL
jgi:hypothetical protein